MNVVIVPCHGRPGFLRVMLDILSKSKGFADHHYLFALDHGHHEAVPWEIAAFCKKHVVRYQVITPPKVYKKPGKQSFNIINAYREAVKLNPDLVYLIEDDIFIANDFFKWHMAVRKANFLVEVSIATKNNNTHDRTLNDLEAYYLRLNDYQSLGVCWSVDLLEFVLGHIEEWYFESPVEYCALKFPRSNIGASFAEQDGLIRRILELNAVPVAFAHVPRAYHAGFEGYNRFGRETLPENIDEQEAMIRRICFSSETMRANTYHTEHFYDSVPVPLENPEWNKQTLVL